MLARTNREAVHSFFRYPGPTYMLVALIVAGVVFVGFVEWHWYILLAMAVVFIVQPWLEWTLHIIVLHDKPRRIGPFVFDTVVARDHRAHHLDPRDMTLLFIPLRWVGYMYLTVVGVAVFNLIHFDVTVAVSVALAQTMMALIYEWTHFWIHQDTVPTNWYAKLIKRNHRNHHYRNSTYWLGVTSNIADYVIGTAPDPRTVPVVDYAKDILKS